MTTDTSPPPEPTKETLNSAWLFEQDTVETWAFWDNLFSEVECEKIIEIGNSRKVWSAHVGPDTDARIVNKNVRDSSVAWLFPGDDTNWVFQRIAGAVDSLNKRFFNFEIYGLMEGLQFTKYEAPTGYYGAHVDRGLGLVPRKLSVSLQLNDSADFEGGELLLHDAATPIKTEMKQGKLVLFPSYMLHEVKPVTKGTRYSLVCWVTGKPFK
jgi:PKHD-type hydroxylase